MKACKSAIYLLCLGWLWAGAASAQQTVPIFVSGQDRSYEILPADEPRVITVRGPGELRLVSRARFRPATDDALGYSLRVRVDGGVEQEVVYEDVGRSRTAMFRDGTLGVPGRLMDYRLQLRRGYHNIEIQPAPDSPQILFRYLFKPQRERRRSWVALTPLGDPERVELVVREAFVPYYRNRPGTPFDVEVIGPTELRIFTRIESTPEMRGRIHYRLQVREGEQVINTFQLSSRRSEVATYSDLDTLVPGRAAEVVIPIPRGRHRLQIAPMDPDKSTLLARFMLPKEDLALTAE
ncbi:MAG: hypothetical protein AAF657_18610 [Acidobacteriota bacterium]